MVSRWMHHHAVDMRGRDGLLVDDGADVQLLGQIDVFDVLDLCYRLAHAQPFGGQAGQDVVLGVGREGAEGLHAAYAFVDEQMRVASVSLDDHSVVGVEQFAEFLAACLALLNHFEAHLLRHVFDDVIGDVAAAHDHDVFHVGIIVLAHDVAYGGHLLLRRHEVSDVALLQLGVAAGDDGLFVALYGHDMVGRSRPA